MQTSLDTGEHPKIAVYILFKTKAGVKSHRVSIAYLLKQQMKTMKGL